MAFAPDPNLPEGEQFTDLVQWLEMGLTRLEIEAIKARGVSQLLQHMQQGLTTASPPDLDCHRRAHPRRLGRIH